MRFPFFWLKRRSKEEMAKRKFGRLCCWHQGTESLRQSRNTGDSELTTVVRDTSPVTGNSLDHDDVYLWRQQALTSFLNAGCSISSKPDRHMEDPAAATLHSFLMQSDVTTHSKTDALDTTPLVYAMNGSPRLTDIDKQRPASRKGPGLGSVDDTPPTRLSSEMMRQGFEEFTRRHQRNESIGNQAPELPTRLEVRRDHFSGPKLPQLRTVDAGKQKSASRTALGSHALPEPISPLGDSLSPPRRCRSPVLDRNAALVSYEVKSIFSESTRASRSLSPVGATRQSSPSADPESSNDQPTQQEAEAQWEIHESTAENRPSKKQSATEIEEEEEEQTVRHSITRLRRWKVHLRLGWLSENANDLVAEIRLTESRPPRDDIAQTSRAVEGQTSHEMHSNEISEYEGNYPEYGNREISVSNSAHMMQDAHNRQNVVYIVDRVLSELQKQKRRTRNKAYTEKAEMLDRQSKIDKTAHRRRQTEQQDVAFGTEISREQSEPPAERVQNRHEVLQAFEVLVKKKEAQIKGSDGKREVERTFSSEKQLTEAVYSDLRQEISRLQYELINKASSGEKNSDGLAEALSLPLKSTSTPSRESGLSVYDGYRERLAKEKCPERRRSQSDPTSSARPPVIQFPSSQPVQRSVSCYEESVSTPESFFAFCLPHQRSNTDERLAKVALLSEVRPITPSYRPSPSSTALQEMLFMRGTDSEARVA